MLQNKFKMCSMKTGKTASVTFLCIRFPQIQGFPSWRSVKNYIMFSSRHVIMMWSHRQTFFYLFIWFSLFLLPFYVFTESLCCRQNICVHLCVCLPLTWTNSSSFIDVEAPRLSKQNPALNGWLYRLLWSFACHPLSFHPQNCWDPSGYIHRHMCMASIYKMNVEIWIH